MTTTTHRTDDLSSTVAAEAAMLLHLLDDALWACGEHDPDRLHTGTVAGHALASLAAAARAMTSALGHRPGTALVDGPGVVVVRDLAAATRTLAVAVSATTTDVPAGAEVSDLVRTVRGLMAPGLPALVARGPDMRSSTA